MKKSIFDDVPDVYKKTVRKRKKYGKSFYSAQAQERKKTQATNPQIGKFKEFMSQDVSAEDFVFIPEEYAGITIFVLFLTLPKVIGMGFFFFYVSEGNIENYHLIHTGGSMLDWVVGYEIVAVVFLLIIAKNLIDFVFTK